MSKFYRTAIFQNPTSDTFSGGCWHKATNPRLIIDESSGFVRMVSIRPVKYKLHTVKLFGRCVKRGRCVGRGKSV
jgi:hypothetical protein